MTTHPILLLVLWALPIGQPRAASACALEAQSLTHTVASIWDRLHHQRRAALRDGSRAANAAVPGRLQGLNFSAQTEGPVPTDSPAPESTISAALSIQLGSLSASRRAQIDAQWRVTDARLEQERWRFVEAVQSAYWRWYKADLERTHLERYLAVSKAELEPVRRASTNQFVSQLDLADLEAEGAWIGAELTQAQRRSTLAAAQVHAALGAPCTLVPIEFPHDEQPLDADAENPWGTLLSDAAMFPELATLHAREKALLATSRRQEAANPWIIQGGLSARTSSESGSRATYIGPTISLNIPLQSAKSAAAIARAKARSTQTLRQRKLAQIEAGLRAQVANYDALVTGYRQLHTDYVEPLERRAGLMERAFEGAHIPISRLIRARREAHEAHHMLLLQHAEIDALTGRALMIRQLLSAANESDK